MTTGEAENEIYDLRKKADLELQAGSVEAFNQIQQKISQLQQASGAVSGRGEDTHAGIDY